MTQAELMDDLKAAMRARDQVKLRTLRSLKAALQTKEIELREGGEASLTDQQILAVLQKQAKQRRDAIEQFDAAGREDLSAKEREELVVIEAYLPKQLDDAALRKAIKDLIAETGATSMRDMGKIMGPAMQRLRGKADGKRVQAMVRELLST